MTQPSLCTAMALIPRRRERSEDAAPDRWMVSIFYAHAIVVSSWACLPRLTSWCIIGFAHGRVSSSLGMLLLTLTALNVRIMPLHPLLYPCTCTIFVSSICRRNALLAHDQPMWN